MKKSKIALILSATTLMTLVLAACNGRGAVSSAMSSSSSETPASSSSPSATVTKVTANNVPVVKVNTELDLDTIVVITMSDGTTTSKVYTVTCSDASVTLTGHIFKATAPGDFVVVVVAGGKTIKVTIDVKTEADLGLIDFFKTVDLTPSNYTIRDLKYNSTTKSFDYDGLSFFHNEKYVAIYDETNPGSTTSSGEANSTLLATLSNGKSYWGSLDSTGKPVFDAGVVNFGDYYITSALSVDGNAFASTIETDGTETIVAPAAVTTAFINSAFGQSGVSGYEIGTTEVVGYTDANSDGKFEDVTLAAYVTKDSTDYVFQIFTIKAVGTTKVDFMETAITDASYVPADITAPEVVNEFTAVKEAGNYTTTIEMYCCDSKGAPIPTATIAATPANYNYTKMFGNDGLGYRQTTTITSDGLFSKYETLDIATTVAAATATLGNEAAYFNRDSKAYKVAYDTTTKKATTTEVSGATDVWTTEAAKLWTVEGVTDAAINSTEWTKKTVSGTATTFEGKVGDNDGTTQGNLLFAQMFDQFGFIAWGTDKEGTGTYLTSASDFTTSTGTEKHALTVYSDWASFTVDPTAKTISAQALVYLPIGKAAGSAYVMMEYSVSAVGTTTNDFSAFTVA